MSNDLKYVLLPKIETRRRAPKNQPWYREQFKRKYPCHIDTKNWKFVKDGLDDFRDGLPPSHDDIILEPDKGPSPVIRSQKRRIKANASDIRNRLTDHQIYSSRELPTAERRRQLIDNYISIILDHPIAFFTHFTEVLPPDMYEQLTQLLEAELLRMNDDNESLFSDEYKEIRSLTSSIPITRAATSVTQKTTSQRSIQTNNPSRPAKSDTKSSSTRPTRNTIVYDESGTQWDSEELERKEKNPFRWFIEKQREKQTPKELTLVDEATSAMETRLRHVAEQFCNWLRTLSDETDVDIEPVLVRNLFSTIYDNKPSLSVPIKIVEMTRIPPELREGVQETMVARSEQTKSTLPELHLSPSITKSDKLPTFSTNSEGQSPRKYRYGAWYLPTNLWQRSLTTEGLRDPKEIKAELEDASRIRDEQSNAHLASLHGLDSFREYLVEKNVRRLPKLITDVDQYRVNHPREITDSNGEFPAKQIF